MIHSTPSPDLIVIGAGLIGLAAAREAAARGLSVAVLDRGEPGGGASRAAAGMLSPLSEASEGGVYLRFGLESLKMYGKWVEELEDVSGVEVEYRECGKFRLARNAEEEAHLQDTNQIAEVHGLRSELLSGDALRTELPDLTDEVTSALLVHDDYRVSARKLSRALATAALAIGVDLRAGSAVRSVLTEGDRATGVLLENGGVLQGGAVLLAAGAWSATIGGVRVPPQVRPVRGQMVAIHPRDTAPARVIEAVGVYLVPRDDGRLLVGATAEEVGFLEGNTVGGVRTLLAAAERVFPGLQSAALGEIWSGLRPASADGHPYLGKDPAIEGLFHASGHFRNGVLLAPATAKALAPLLTRGSAEGIPPDFSPARIGTAGDHRSS